MMTAIRPVEPLLRRTASGETTYDRSLTRALIRARVSSETPGAPLSTRDTVALETPAIDATSAMFSRPFGATTAASYPAEVMRGRNRFLSHVRVGRFVSHGVVRCSNLA